MIRDSAQRSVKSFGFSTDLNRIVVFPPKHDSFKTGNNVWKKATLRIIFRKELWELLLAYVAE